MVGIDFPLGFLVCGAAVFYRHTVNRAIVGTPDGSGYQGVGLVFIPGPLSRELTFPKAETGQEKQNQQEPGDTQVSQLHGSRIRNSHRLRSLPPLLLHSLLRPLSVRADRW